MKHKVLIGAACISIILGAMLVGAGFGLGGELHDVYGIHFGNGYFGFGDGDHRKATATSEQIEIKEFKDLYMDISIGDIEIKRGSSLSLSIVNVPSDEVSVKQEQGTLTIESYQDTHLFNFSFESLDYKFILTIPDTMNIDTGLIISNMGDVELANLSFQTLTVSQHMGDINVTDVNSEQMSLDQSMGDITYKGSHPGNMTVDNSMGDIDLDIQDDISKYRYECSTSMGSIKVNQQHQDGLSEDVSGGSKQAPYFILVDNSMGDIEVKFDDN